MQYIDENNKQIIKLQHEYTNIGAAFTGIGYVLIDFNAIVEYISRKYNVDTNKMPMLLILEYFEFLDTNLKDVLQDVRYLDRDGKYSEIKRIITKCFNCTFYSGISENERIAMIITGLDCDFISKAVAAGFYVSVLDTFIFRVPYVYAQVFIPAVGEEKIDIGKYTGISTEKEITNWREQLKNKYSLKDVKIRYTTFDEPVKEDDIYDGYLQNNAYEYDQINPSDINYDLINDIPYEQNDLDLVMPEIPEKMSIRHIQNLARSAKSLCDGAFMYNTSLMYASGEETEISNKINKKKQKIIEENQRKKASEKYKTDNVWLNNFFTNYQKLNSHSDKKAMIECIKINNVFIQRRLSLLKIELYNSMWSVETKGMEPDESKLIPLYLECMDYIQKYNKKEKGDYEINIEEMKFVIEIFSSAGFNATAEELINQYEIEGIETSGKLKISDVDLYFQLKYTGQYLKRSLGTKPDKRVPFEPDAWQVELLDAVDDEKSVVISAPTSSGKTFICYYVVEKLLRAKNPRGVKPGTAVDNDEFISVITNKEILKKKTTQKLSSLNIVVFCLPTKALANQVSADIYARFKPQKNINLQGTLMNDRTSEPFNCQILITIPSMLEIVLNNNAVNCKYLVMDEVHKINTEKLGLEMERVIHLANCPILLLSATIGNLDQFYGWFKRVEESKGRECKLITHKERFCEIRYFSAQIDKSINLIPLNCMFAYTHSHLKDFGFGDDLQFLPEELLNIYYYIYMALPDENKRLIKKLAPKKFFSSNIISKADVKQYEKHLLNYFQEWVQREILSEDEVKRVYELLTGEANKNVKNDITEEDILLENIMSVADKLHESDLLPAIFFNTDRDMCSKIGKRLYKEMCKRDKIPEIDKTRERLNKSKKEKEEVKKKDAWIEESIQNEQQSVDVIKFTYCSDLTKLTEYEIKEELSGAPNYIVEMALRGIGLHHNELSRRVKCSMEILFRKKHIRVLIATDTLALGINMPCRTTVFYGDSLQLDPMNFKQMAGRAGRRGFDTLGNVVFVGIPKHRIQNLMVSMLPKISGGNILNNTTLCNFSKIAPGVLNNSLCNISDSLENKLEKLTLNNRVTDIVKKYKFIYPCNYLNELFITNRSQDVSIFIFGYLYDRKLICFDENPFMLLISSLFETIPTMNPDVSLSPLSDNIRSVLNNINNDYQNIINDQYNTSILNIMNENYYMNNYLFYVDVPLNSYVYDFYQHGSVGKLKNINNVPNGEIWVRLGNILNVIDSCIRMMGRINPDGEEYKKLLLIRNNFDKKYKAMFA